MISIEAWRAATGSFSNNRCGMSFIICDPTLEKGAYGANYDIEICERKDGKL